MDYNVNIIFRNTFKMYITIETYIEISGFVEYLTLIEGEELL